MEAKAKQVSSGRTAGACPDCRNVGGFKKVLHLPDSDLDIYMHREQKNLKQKGTSFQTIKAPEGDTFIVHNANPMELNQSTVIRELNTYKPKCISCRGIVKRVQGLLKEIKTIRENKTYAACEHCKLTTGKCKRCDYIISEFKSEQKQQLEDQRQRFKQWLSQVKELLQAIISGGRLCRYGLHQETADVCELENLFRELYPPEKRQRQPEIGAFPSITSAEDLAISQDMVRQVIHKLKVEGGRRYSSADSLFVSPSQKEDCVCKIFQDRAVRRISRELLTHQLTTSKVMLDEAIEKRKSEELFLQRTELPKLKEKPAAKRGQGKRPKEGHKEQDIVSRTDHKIVDKKATKLARKASPKIKVQSLVTVHRKQSLFVDDEATSVDILKCEDERLTKEVQREMIRGLEIVPYDKDYSAIEDDSVHALLFKTYLELESKTPMIPSAKSNSTVRSANTLRSKKTDDTEKEEDRSGVVLYRLSDRKFIDIGWTKLPTTKIMRKMNIYKMLPAKSFDWFDQNKDKETMYYESGEKLSEIGESGRGFWFYKNGLVALEYYDEPDTISKKRFTVFSYEVDGSKSKLQIVLACFDYCGNGIVYDGRGNERLKYNQSEGYVFDEKIGPPGLWKWHTMNDPPVLEQIFIDTYAKDPSPELEEMMEQDRRSNYGKNDSNEMLAMELKNIAKETADKMRKNFKPFEIRMKAMKINDFFSLKVIDQSNIHLLYRDGALQLKLNLGMLLQSDEIIATDVQEAGVVETPYDRRPSRGKYLNSNMSIN